MDFDLVSNFRPTGDQPAAIKQLTNLIKEKSPHSVLLGVTGSGKTYTIANLIKKTKMPCLVISHNKTLAAQLYQEFRDFFPNNAVSYFVSYYDYYQPEAYIPNSDTYIEKEAQINEEIDKLRLRATTNLLTRDDVIVVSSVSCIYNLGSPVEYGKFILDLQTGSSTQLNQIILRLTDLQYQRNDYEFTRGTFRVRGESIDLMPSYMSTGIRIDISNNKIVKMLEFDPLTGEKLLGLEKTVIYPAKHYMTDPAVYSKVFKEIQNDLDKQVTKFKSQNKLLEAQRITQRTNHDLDMIKELGYVNGIENYSIYFDGRKPGQAPYTLIDYFNHKNKDWLFIIDESHITLPQIRGMYNGDRSRKEVLIDYGFRLPSALDNRPLKFDEVMRLSKQNVYVSATPDEYELSLAKPYNGVVEQLIRPTGLLDPKVTIKKTKDQIPDLIEQIAKRSKKGERVLVTTLTKRMSEDLTAFLQDKKIKVSYLHSDIQTLERQDLLDSLRSGEVDVLIGINLLREGLDLPEVSLVAILDADKEGFLRSRTSLIQIMGRAARHTDSEVILYADNITKSIKSAVEEVERRRKIQMDYNTKHNIKPISIKKDIRKALIEKQQKEPEELELSEYLKTKDVLLPDEKKKLIAILKKQMRTAAENLDFETAIKIRNQLKAIS